MSTDVRKLVAQNVKRCRLASGMSQAELAAAMDVDRSYVSGLEQGVRNPTIVTLWHVAQALSVPVAEFFVGERRRR